MAKRKSSSDATATLTASRSRAKYLEAAYTAALNMLRGAKGEELLAKMLADPNSAAARAVQKFVLEFLKSSAPPGKPPASGPPETPRPSAETSPPAPQAAPAGAAAVSPPPGGAAPGATPPAAPPKPPSTPGGGDGSGEGGGGQQGGGADAAAPGAFDPRDLHRTVIAIPLAEAMDAVESGKPLPTGVRYYGREPDASPAEQAKVGQFPVIVDLNLDYPGGRERARHRVYDLLTRVLARSKAASRRLADAVPGHLRDSSPQYVFADLYAEEIRELARVDNSWRAIDANDLAGADLKLRESRTRKAPRAVFRIWPSHSVRPLLTTSVATIKGDAAAATFGASGRGIVWAVMDSGIDGGHRHFQTHRNLADLPQGVTHQDFTGAAEPAPLRDVYGHGTHVAGIIAGVFKAQTAPPAGQPAIAPAQMLTYVRDERDRSSEQLRPVSDIRGVAPQCKLVSYKVLDDRGRSDDVRNIIAALEHVARINEHGLNIRIHGVNLSLGYPFEPRWFACGHSPLCQVIDRLVRSGVVVVAAAGNTGYAYVQTVMAGVWAQGATLSINDPGNADAAITVGSTHREEPYRYGASYFSSKGPTGDGRVKPDLLAPGEKIVSCASYDWSQHREPAMARPEGMSTAPNRPEYREESGTSMAAPHVSAAVAAFLSIRREFIGRPEVIKDIFLKSASDLGRERYLQGRGLLDLLRALQSV